MKIERLVIQNFRNQQERVLEDLADARVVALVGPNGAGKTSILEAVSVLGGGRGVLGADAKVQMGWDAKRDGGWGVNARLADGREVAVGWRPKSDSGVRTVLVDGQKVNGDELARVVPLVWLAPALDRLFFETPGVRRDWLDDLAAQLVPGHAEAVRRYTGHLRGRMKLLLTQQQQGGVAEDWLTAEEAQAARWGVKVLRGRVDYCLGISGLRDVEVSGEGVDCGAVVLAVEGAAVKVLDEADPEAALAGKLARSRAVDVRMGRTMAGANTVDVVADIELEGGRRVKLAQASSGQHKRGLVRLLLAHARLVRAELGVAPLVLMDEFSAHLDAVRRAALLEAVIALGCQVWCTDVAWDGGGAGVRVVGVESRS